MIAAGLATPLGAALLAATMVEAIKHASGQNGFWNANGGYEYNLALAAAALALADDRKRRDRAHAVREVVDLAQRLGDRLALLGRQRRREVLRVLVDEVRGLGEDRRALQPALASGEKLDAHAGRFRHGSIGRISSGTAGYICAAGDFYVRDVRA